MKKDLRNIKIVFLDIDGTLRNSKKEVTEYTKSTLTKLKQKGIYAVLCSGRQGFYMRKLSKDINASKYIIAYNGAAIYDYEDNIDIFESPMEKDTLERMWEFCEKEDLELVLTTKEEIYGNTKASTEQSSGKLKNINNIDDVSDKRIIQVIIEVKTERSEEIKEILYNQEKAWIANHGVSDIGYFFDVNNKGMDKGIGIAKLIEYLGINKEEAICFGDGVNDYAMFRECGTRVAMGNAEEELKKEADYITLTNDEDGVAKFIEKYILNQ